MSLFGKIYIVAALIIMIIKISFIVNDWVKKNDEAEKKKKKDHK